MLKYRNAELVLGALFATLLWVGIWGWTDSYAPTETQKKECYESAKKSTTKAEECKTIWERTTTDPIAFFTFILAVSTIGLWCATIGLYFTGEKQIGVTKETADAAKLNAQAVIDAERARLFIVIDGENIEDMISRVANMGLGDDAVSGLHLSYAFKNYGKTPAIIREISHGTMIALDLLRVREYEPVVDLPAHILGANERMPSIDVPDMPRLTTDNASSIKRAENTFWFFGRIIYDDTFGWRRTLKFIWHYGADSNGFRVFEYKEKEERRPDNN